jgi:SPP1 family holin
MEEDNNMDKASIGRVVTLAIVLLNAVLNLFGYQTIPTEFGEHISAIVLIVVSLWSAWKNNYLSKKGGLQKKALQAQGLYKK